MATYSTSQNFNKPTEPSAGLFDRIIAAITLEQEFKQTRKILFAFIFLLLVSAAFMPFSFSFFAIQWNSSGVFYFISAATVNASVFFDSWEDFVLSILESLPVMAITLFAINVAALLFSIRLFLYKKGLLLKYLSSQIKS